MEAVVEKVARKFHEKFGCDTFGIGSDEYLDSILWQPDHFLKNTTKQEIVDGFYRVTSDLSRILKNMGMTVRQWNDDLLRNIRHQEPNEVFPEPTKAQIESLDKDEYSQYW
jgi:N-acetyl-beta-hexosaminidase